MDCESQNKHSLLNTREFTRLGYDLCNLNNLNSKTNTLREAGKGEETLRIAINVCKLIEIYSAIITQNELIWELKHAFKFERSALALDFKGTHSTFLLCNLYCACEYIVLYCVG